MKLLHGLYHKNVVRIFHHFLYPMSATGYILMEYIDGTEIDHYLARSPEQANDCFAQAISGFAYLESVGVLHRDIRPQNLMVTSDGVLKIIDLGFGKKVERGADFRKSISLNWHCTAPEEFSESVYDFQTEIYFLGRLFKRLIEENSIADFKYESVVARISAARPEHRPPSFRSIETEVQSERVCEVDFTDSQIEVYREFATTLFSYISKIEKRATYITDPQRVVTRLAEAFRSVSMEAVVPNGDTIVRCFLTGGYYYHRHHSKAISVEQTRHFLTS